MMCLYRNEIRWVSLVFIFNFICASDTRAGEQVNIEEFYNLSTTDFVKFRLLEGDSSMDIANKIVNRSKERQIDELIVASSLLQERKDSDRYLLIAKAVDVDVFQKRSDLFLKRCYDMNRIREMSAMLRFLQESNVKYTNLTEFQILHIFNTEQYGRISLEDLGKHTMPFLRELENVSEWRDAENLRMLLKNHIKIASIKYEDDPYRVKETLDRLLKRDPNAPNRAPTKNEPK